MVTTTNRNHRNKKSIFTTNITHVVSVTMTRIGVDGGAGARTNTNTLVQVCAWCVVEILHLAKNSLRNCSRTMEFSYPFLNLLEFVNVRSRAFTVLIS